MRTSLLRKRIRWFLSSYLAILGGDLALFAGLPPSSDGISLTVEVPPLAGERFKTAQFRCWLPNRHGPLKGVIIHQHGCGEPASARSSSLIEDTHWRALARKHGFALMAPGYAVERDCQDWNEPTHGSERALLAALDTLAVRTHRPEMNTLPWVLWGHSGGSSWVARMVLRHPSRILAASLRGGASIHFGDLLFRDRFRAAARNLPMLFILGKGEALPSSKHHVSWQPMHDMYRALRQQGGLVALGVDPLTEHHCGNSRLLVIPFFDAILSARSNGRTLPGTLVDTVSYRQMPVTIELAKNPGFVWLPSPTLARIWTEFIRTGRVTVADPVIRRPILTAQWGADSLPVVLNWQVEPTLNGGIRSVRIYRNDSLRREIGVTPTDFVALHGDTPPPELILTRWVDEQVPGGVSQAYAISFVNAIGTESPRSKAVMVRLPVLH